MRNPLKVSILTLLSIVLAACGGADDSGVGPEPGEGLSKEEARAFADVAINANTFVLSPFIGGFTFSSVADTFLFEDMKLAAGLETLQECRAESGDSTDYDGDGIPVDLTETYACDFTFEGGQYIQRGSVRTRDKDDTNPASGYVMTVDNYELTVIAGGESSTIKLDMTFDLTISSTSYRADYDFDLSVSSPDAAGAVAFDYTITYTPDDPAMPFTAGSFAFDGNLRYSDEGEAYSLSMSSSGLHYSSACGDFDGGSASYRDSAGNTVNVTYNSCGDVTATYNGSPL